ncbi:MAG: 5-formyltetrahydrofolate cyclo-ligase [Nitrospirae bacterium]|nr:5-formyltetrahydrofolate cyclo-ligase [Nitrospirota bacterium]
MTIQEQKKLIRKEVIEKRDSLTPEEQARMSLEIKNRLFMLDEFINAGKVHIFVSFGSEVRTEGMIGDLLSLGKKVIVPLVDTKNNVLILSEINDFDRDLSKGHFGILEPKVIKKVDKKEIDLMIMPGVAFDNKGNRLGYGAGYYDKLLKEIDNNIPLVALGFEIQVVDFIPFLEYDVKIHKIVTEKRVISCHNL